MVGSFLWRGLGLDVPGEGGAACSGAVDWWQGGYRRSGVAPAEVIVGCMEGAWAWHG